MARITSELAQLAGACGLLTAYEDVHKRRQEASVESLLAVLNALGVDVPSLGDVPQALAARRLAQLQRGLEPVVVGWDGEPPEFDLTVPAQHAAGKAVCTVELEDHAGRISEQFDLGRMVPQATPGGRFVTLRVRLAHGLNWGYHRLTIEIAGRTYESQVISAPRRAYVADSARGAHWGCFLPLYSLRSGRNWGAGDFTDLQNLAGWTARLGGAVVGTLPMLAAYLDEPCEFSPYAPVSRLAWNEFYVDVASIPELAGCPGAAEFMQSSVVLSEVTRLRESEQVDYRRVTALKRQVLERLAEAFFQEPPQPRYAEFERFLQQHAHLVDYAEFRAAHERQQVPWYRWPHPLREGRLSDEDYDRRSKHYHLYAQWIATEQLESLAGATGGGLYLDLPLGVRPDGYDVYRWRELYVSNTSAGSPPDSVWTQGQDWGFPPLHPERIREQGYRHVRDYLTHHLRLARLLRIDHVMQLHRLYWIPHGMRAGQGVYVGYRPDEFYAILNLESHRCRTTLVGENLGTVPPAVNRAMEAHNVQRMYVVQYEIASSEDDPHSDAPLAVSPTEAGPREAMAAGDTRRVPATLSAVPAGSLASLNTHDMASFAAWWRGTDISLRQQLGMLTREAAGRERDDLENTKSDLTIWLRSKGWLVGSETGDAQILRAILKFLSASKASVVLVNLEDLWLETRPQNVPGTGPELPNWRRKTAVTFEEFSQRPDILALLREVAQWRREAGAAATTRARQTR
jgi:4-alpha-glucanotransferase